ncbi:MAG: STAS domain-containing protein [Pseudomonadales bacterium]|nr:STAS domain-containing protein [Pseudomonadales bacterium]MCP5185222.1 STAS domain-containing protein [Pseudomonadales bacterium]
MAPGRIMVGDTDGVYLLKLVGDVRVTLCISAEGFIHRMLADPEFKAVTIDLSDARGMDSTSLGILARIAIETRRQHNLRPTVLVTNPDLEKLIRVSGLADEFKFVRSAVVADVAINELPQYNALDEGELRRRVIDAHRTLMSMNAANEATFRDLVLALEAEERGPGGC